MGNYSEKNYNCRIKIRGHLSKSFGLLPVLLNSVLKRSLILTVVNLDIKQSKLLSVIIFLINLKTSYTSGVSDGFKYSNCVIPLSVLSSLNSMQLTYARLLDIK